MPLALIGFFHMKRKNGIRKENFCLQCLSASSGFSTRLDGKGFLCVNDKSPMPFGFFGFFHIFAGISQIRRLQRSPMPFGFFGFFRRAVVGIKKNFLPVSNAFRLLRVFPRAESALYILGKRLQCLSASSGFSPVLPNRDCFHSGGVSNAFRLLRVFPLPSGSIRYGLAR